MAAREIGLAALAWMLGILATLGRLMATRDPQPVIRQGFLFRAVAEGSLGLFGWIVARAFLGLDGLAAMAIAYGAGLLGYAAVHDLALRKFGSRINPP